MSNNIAVVLSGSGYLDGSEIRESVFTILALSKRELSFEFFAPNIDINEVDHLTGKQTNNTRNTLIESARIARGNISDIKSIDISKFDAIVFPGGFGAAKNLCSFALEAENGIVNEEIKKTILEFNNQNKPIVGICIAPALIALTLGHKNIKVTIGNDIETAKRIEKTGAKHIVMPVTAVCVDPEHKILTTPAYMYSEASEIDIFIGIDLCIEEMLKFISQ